MEKTNNSFFLIEKITNLFKRKIVEHSYLEKTDDDNHSDLSSGFRTGFSHDEYLNCKEMLCPKPIFEISMKLRSMESGKVLKVECRDLAFEKDIRAWVKRTGNQILFSNFQGRVFTTLIKKR